MQNNVTELTQRLLRALDSNYNVRISVVFIGNSVFLFRWQWSVPRPGGPDCTVVVGCMYVNKIVRWLNKTVCAFRNVCYSTGCHMIAIKFSVLCHR